jgi:ketosteroid isomerase-like protein
MEAGAHIGKIVLATAEAGEEVPCTASPASARAAWIEAVCTRDLTALEALIDDEFVYVHSTGRVDDRASYLEYVRTGPDFLAFEFSVPQPRVSHDVAAFTGELRLTLRRTPAEDQISLDVHAIQLWRRVAGRWRLSAAQTTRRASASSCPEGPEPRP